MKYAIPFLMFLANDELVSVIALTILTIVFVADVWKARFERDAE